MLRGSERACARRPWDSRSGNEGGGSGRIASAAHGASDAGDCPPGSSPTNRFADEEKLNVVVVCSFMAELTVQDQAGDTATDEAKVIVDPRSWNLKGDDSFVNLGTGGGCRVCAVDPLGVRGLKMNDSLVTSNTAAAVPPELKEPTTSNAAFVGGITVCPNWQNPSIGTQFNDARKAFC